MNITKPAVALLSALLLLNSTGCSIFKPSDQQVIGQADQVHSTLAPAVITDPQVQRYLDQVGQRIVDAAIEYDKEPNKPSDERKTEDNSWMYNGGVKFHLVNSQTLNAFTTGGQHIYIYNQLFQETKTEDELAAVVSHEFAHVYARHVAKSAAKQYIPIATAALGAVAGYAAGGKDRTSAATAGAGLGAAGGQLFSNKFTRDQENEADKLGFRFYIRAGWDPNHFADFFQHMIDKGLDTTPELMSDHPALKNRVAATHERAKQIDPSKNRQRPPIAQGRAYEAIRDRAVAVAKNTPDDKSLAAAQLMLQAFPSCVTPEDQADQKAGQKRLLQAMDSSEPATPAAPAKNRRR